MIKKWYSGMFARVYDPFMHQTEVKVFSKKRKSLFASLHGKILDVGSGTGANFPHFPADAEIIALEPNNKMMEFAANKIPESANIKLILGGVGDGKVEFEEAAFDFIVTTLVLCTIPDQRQAFELFKKWLKPHGKLIMIEHIRSPKMPVATLQDVFNPAWKIIGDGCNMNRKTDKLVQEVGFTPITENYFKLGFDWYEGIFEVAK